ncbi:eukaryotic translation initiation factor 4E type 2 isoform X1 [Hydra vulgaris]|uniref:Eukaryotic translation initiation factor 4E type 2 n=1 Tax=Hydra vulgaris TaxID=6087 RepID=T2MIV9_HYDVU|nr:eukaryotic translation initiation factor 4E type 2 [Hydra vulgaris]
MATNKFEALAREDSNDSSSKSDEEVENGEVPADESASKEDSKEETNKYVFPDEPVIENGEHRLQDCYCLWFSRKSHGKQPVTQKYEDSIKLIGAFASVEQFWAYYLHMVRPGELTGHSDIHLFKYGIRPMWEDKANKNGGKWIVRLKKGLASRCWENLILAMLGEQFMVGQEICGAVVSIRYQEDIISIWNRNASDQATTSRIRDTLRRVLNLPQNTIMEYKAHMASLTDHSSYRNTSVFVK